MEPPFMAPCIWPNKPRTGWKAWTTWLDCWFEKELLDWLADVPQGVAFMELWDCEPWLEDCWLALLMNRAWCLSETQS